jgi:hypothetical protein
MMKTRLSFMLTGAVWNNLCEGSVVIDTAFSAEQDCMEILSAHQCFACDVMPLNMVRAWSMLRQKK